MRTYLFLAALLVVGAVSVSAGEVQSNLAVDPVCGIRVARNPELSLDYDGQTYYFCMNADRQAFRKNPEKFLGENRQHRHGD